MKKIETTLIKMTDAYEYQSFYNSIDNLNIIDCRDLNGTRCYLDDSAKDIILERISPYSAQGIHFIDSGNYHYLSLLWLSMLDTDFNLILFDHHPDNQPPSFGPITSCGGWVLEAIDTVSHLKNVYTFGVGDLPNIAQIPHDIPIYISIDKDVLSEEYALTDWDQGDMTLDEMKNFILELLDGRKLLGADICGDSGENAENAGILNNLTNLSLFDFLLKKF